MRVSLLEHPWSAAADHDIEADSAAELRARLASLPAARFAAAVWVAGRPQSCVVQGSRVDYPNCVSADGFAVVRTGLAGARHADEIWSLLLGVPGMIARYEAFFGAATRPAMYPALALVPHDGVPAG